MAPNIQVKLSLALILNMAKANKFGQMDQFTRDGGRMEKQMVMAVLSMQTVMYTWVCG